MKKIYLISFTDESENIAFDISSIVYTLDDNANCELIKSDEDFVDVFFNYFKANDVIVFIGHPNLIEGAPDWVKEKVNIIFDSGSYEKLKEKIADYIKKAS